MDNERHDDPDRIDPITSIVVFLHGIWKLLYNFMPRRREPFALDIITNSASGATRIGGDHSSGIVRCIWNPTGATVTVTLYDGETAAGTPRFNAQLVAGAVVLCWIPFFTQISASSGTGAAIAGEYRM